MKQLCRVLLPALLALITAVPPSFAEQKEWRIDSVHSYVGFKVRHMMVTWVRGRFVDVAGTASFDPADLSQVRVEVEIDAASIDTRNERRDKHLRSADFLDVEKFPKIRFVSKRIAGTPETGLKLIGDLTLHGVTKEVTLDMEGPAPAVADGRGGEKSGVSASGAINRQAYGLTWNRAIEAGGVTVGDEVLIEIEAELAREAPGGGQPKTSGD